MKEQSIDMWGLIDYAMADAIGVSVEEYILRIEHLLEKNPKRGKVLVAMIFDSSEEQQKRAINLFLQASSDYIS